MNEQTIPRFPDDLPVKRKLPPLLWIALVFLGLVTLLTLLSSVKGHSGIAFATVLCNVALMIGLARGHKWAYALTVIFSFGGAMVAMSNSFHKGLVILILNSVVLVPVLMSTRFFFPRDLRHNRGIDLIRT